MAHDHGPPPVPGDPGDAEVCVCFHVRRRKIEAFCRRERPKVISLVSQCLSAGTGCGWCIPFLTSIRAEVLEGGPRFDLPSREEYLARRKAYHRETGWGRSSDLRIPVEKPDADGGSPGNQPADSARSLARSLERTVEEALPLLLAIPDGPETARPNRPSGKGWSRREEIGHLVDSAVNNHARFVRAALEPEYAGPGYEQERWVEVHRYVGLPWPFLVETWRAHNAILVPLVAGIPDAGLATPCTVGDGAPVPLGFLVDDYVLHMRHHLDQILRREPVTRYPRG